jgi:hypothetical protein
MRSVLSNCLAVKPLMQRKPCKGVKQTAGDLGCLRGLFGNTVCERHSPSQIQTFNASGLSTPQKLPQTVFNVL